MLGRRFVIVSLGAAVVAGCGIKLPDNSKSAPTAGSSSAASVISTFITSAAPSRLALRNNAPASLCSASGTLPGEPKITVDGASCATPTIAEIDFHLNAAITQQCTVNSGSISGTVAVSLAANSAGNKVHIDFSDVETTRGYKGDVLLTIKKYVGNVTDGVTSAELQMQNVKFYVNSLTGAGRIDCGNEAATPPSAMNSSSSDYYISFNTSYIPCTALEPFSVSSCE